jgi:hypothetical protein
MYVKVKKCIHSHKISFVGDREPRQYHDYAIGWITKNSRFNLLAGERNFSLLKNIQTSTGNLISPLFL